MHGCDIVKFIGICYAIYCIAGNFRGTKYLWFSNIEIFRTWVILSWLLLGL